MSRLHNKPTTQASMSITEKHWVTGRDITQPPKDNEALIYFAMGCFWGAERLFWQQPGVITTAVGYAGGSTLNPTYQEVCRGDTGHAEVVKVRFDPQQITLERLLTLFWQNHDPTQGMRQGNDVGSQYRSAIYTTSAAQLEQAQCSMARYQHELTAAKLGLITTEIAPAGAFYFAEEAHQQYLAKHPNGYCGLAGTGICLPPA
ncbi:peptide-methionine (S)-S-oxide reductase MsrA [Vibrio sp. SM6]|uniref:Peptide methionine sulfoxide reductase MsrA n=1 Tax=Vibrio agarilyticus TaxID=2726741 RepID=A0A7X8TPU0_9VIBR|nr:peptide-methionine (S)-S-oxide reductase MsrA [Vibrio agarilyticus]NLS12422.1 peptide-methionine (S)-S-oxide reductase MsrA [Vibrio agarilyticus]